MVVDRGLDYCYPVVLGMYKECGRIAWAILGDVEGRPGASAVSLSVFKGSQGDQFGAVFEEVVIQCLGGEVPRYVIVVVN